MLSVRYLPRVLGNSYGNTVKAWQPAVVAIGALAAAPALKRMTPSSFAQKLRTPDWLKVNGEAPTVYAVLMAPAPANGVTK